MKTKKTHFLQLITGLFLVCTALSAAVVAQGPTRSRDLHISYGDIRGGTCSMTMPGVGMITPNTPPETPLFNRTFRGQPNPVFCDPVLNPDGSQMTLGQYITASGRAAVKCQRNGTHAVFSFDGLRPHGVYSIWIVLPNPLPGPPIGVGSLGRTLLSENTFTADDEGEGQIGRTTPEEDLSIFGHVGPCLLDAPLVFELVYHADNHTHGGDPGPPNTWVTNAVFLFP